MKQLGRLTLISSSCRSPCSPLMGCTAALHRLPGATSIDSARVRHSASLRQGSFGGVPPPARRAQLLKLGCSWWAVLEVKGLTGCPRDEGVSRSSLGCVLSVPSSSSSCPPPPRPRAAEALPLDETVSQSSLFFEVRASLQSECARPLTKLRRALRRLEPLVPLARRASSRRYSTARGTGASSSSLKGILGGSRTSMGPSRRAIR